MATKSAQRKTGMMADRSWSKIPGVNDGVIFDTELAGAVKKIRNLPSHQHDMDRLNRHAAGHEEFPDAEQVGGLSAYEDDLQSRLKTAVFVGHINTDLDSVAGAIGAAALFGGTPALAESIDKLNGEITFALKNCGIEPPRYFGDMEADSESTFPVCLVDHTEEKQMVPSLRDNPNDRLTRIVGVIDHHALAKSFQTSRPIYMDLRPWGSMSTIVGYLFISFRRALAKPLATLLLQAILSDTLNLRSITTTDADRNMVALLTSYGGLGKLAMNATAPSAEEGLYQDTDIDLLAKRQFQAKTNWIVALGPYEMVRGDQKDFVAGPWKIGISVLEVTDTDAVSKCSQEILFELRLLKKEKGLVNAHVDDDKDNKGESGHSSSKLKLRRRSMELDFAFLFVVNVVKQTSIILICGGRELALAKAAFLDNPTANPEGSDSVVSLQEAFPGIQAPGSTIQPHETGMLLPKGYVSRKAQFVPAFFQAIQDDFEYESKGPRSEVGQEGTKKELRGAEELQAKLDQSKEAAAQQSDTKLRRTSTILQSFRTNAMEMLILREQNEDEELVKANENNTKKCNGNLYDQNGRIQRTYQVTDNSKD